MSPDVEAFKLKVQFPDSWEYQLRSGQASNILLNILSKNTKPHHLDKCVKTIKFLAKE